MTRVHRAPLKEQIKTPGTPLNTALPQSFKYTLHVHTSVSANSNRVPIRSYLFFNPLVLFHLLFFIQFAYFSSSTSFYSLFFLSLLIPFSLLYLESFFFNSPCALSLLPPPPPNFLLLLLLLPIDTQKKINLTKLLCPFSLPESIVWLKSYECVYHSIRELLCSTTLYFPYHVGSKVMYLLFFRYL